jgi:hypothetical protein
MKQKKTNYKAENIRTEIRNAKFALNLACEMTKGLRAKIARLRDELKTTT